MTRKIKTVVAIALAGICLTGCSGKITEGEIYEKEYKPEKTSIVTVPIVHTNGKSTYTTIIPVTYHYPDRKVESIRRQNITPLRKYTTSVK